jgi:transposase-like protein
MKHEEINAEKPPKAMSLQEFQAWLPDEVAAVKYFEHTRWGSKPVCPHCKSDDVARIGSGKPMPFRCRSCREHFSVKTGSVMQSSKIGVRTWLLAMYFMSVAKKGVSSCQMARQLGIKQDTAWFLQQRIRESWNQERFLMDGEVEMDETYTGGKEKNKHASKRLHAGRGGTGKTMVVGLRQRKGRIFAVVAKTASKKVLHEIIDQRIAPTATLYTDDHRGYIGAPVAAHVAVKHSVGEYVNGNASTNGVESFWALLKRGYYGTFHKMSEEHLPRYVNEFAPRQNSLMLTTEEQIKATLAGTVGRSLPYKKLIQ